ncbi:hypothetical protein ABPG72_008577 [Tetrahymena utriculariae]
MGTKASKSYNQNNESVELNRVFNNQQNQNNHEEYYKSRVIQPVELVVEETKTDQPQKVSCFKRIFTIIVILATLTEAVYSLYQSYLGYKGFNNLNDQIQLEVTDRYEYRMLQDVQAFSSCNAEWEPLFEYMFQGTNIRCDCRAQGGEITIDFCMPDQQNCIQYNFLNEKLLSVWPFGIDNGLNQQLCVKYYTQDTFATIKDWPTTCPSGKKRCGGQSIESMLCLPEDQQCPLNDMVVAITNPDPLIYNEQIIFNSTHTLFFTRQSNKLPLNLSKVTSGEGPCYDVKQENTYQGREDFFTYKVRRTPCEVDPRWSRVAEVGEYTLYKSNGVDPEDYFQQMWSFEPISDQYRYGFYVSHYPDWKYEFRNLLNKITEFINSRDSIMQYQKTLLGLCAVSLGSNILIGIKIIHLYLTSADEERKQQFDKQKDGFQTTVKLAQIGIAVFQLMNINDYVGAFQSAASNKVSDDRSNTIITQIGNYLHTNVYIADRNLIIGNVVGLFFSLLSLIYTVYQAKKKQQ